ncbi:hypothetical protein CCAND93_710019 [Capnocytophaga canis]|uniref:Uncharacterized protein n=1 Tax=Capnocytophaga canis TaxID=1848903 RepID=A0A0B7IU04_9FLAO|nr:hypothetical protein CCAND93_710019 [Capnocytophaga canis]
MYQNEKNCTFTPRIIINQTAYEIKIFNIVRVCVQLVFNTFCTNGVSKRNRY